MNTYIKIKEYVNGLVVACCKRFNRKDILVEEQRQELINNINNTKNEWDIARSNFELASTQDSVDYYAYKIKAYEVRYQALLREAKEKGVRVSRLCEK